MAKHKLKIARFANPSGEFSHRVSGTLNGRRIRKNFRARDEAVAYRQELEIERLNEVSSGQTVWTTLTRQENRDAIAAPTANSASHRSIWRRIPFSKFLSARSGKRAERPRR